MRVIAVTGIVQAGCPWSREPRRFLRHPVRFYFHWPDQRRL